MCVGYLYGCSCVRVCAALLVLVLQYWNLLLSWLGQRIHAAAAGCCNHHSCCLLSLRQAHQHDYLSKVARLAGVTVERLLENNAAVIKSLDASLAGKTLLLCGSRACSSLQKPAGECVRVFRPHGWHHNTLK